MVFEHLVPGSRVVVRDITGRLVRNSRRLGSAVWRWNLAGVPNGVYCYSVASADGNRELGKVVVLNRGAGLNRLLAAVGPSGRGADSKVDGHEDTHCQTGAAEAKTE